MEALLRGGLMAEDCTFRERTDLLTSGLVPTYLITHTPTGSEFDLRVLPERTWSGRLHLAPTREDVDQEGPGGGGELGGDVGEGNGRVGADS